MTSSFGPGISPNMPQCTSRRRPSGKSGLAVHRERDRTMTRRLPHAESELIYGLFSAPRISTFSAPQTAIFTPKTQLNGTFNVLAQHSAALQEAMAAFEQATARH